MSDRPKFGPGFQDGRSRLYRAEYGALTAALAGYLVWRGVFLGGVDIWQTAFWAVFPDIASFVPIGLSSKQGDWPKWGSTLYNIFHTLLLWGLLFFSLFIVFHIPYWPLLGWLGHITTDRAVGYALRKSS